MTIKFVFLLGLLFSVTSFDLEDSGQPGVYFGEKSPSAQIISVDENNNKTRINFVKVTGVVGEITADPVMGNDILEVRVEDGADDTERYISTNLVDFEALRIENSATTFLIDISEDSGEVHTVSLCVNNTDDESPVLLGSICTLKEETEINVTTSDCVYTVSDPDGFLSQMDFSAITGSRDENDLFEFQYREVPADNVYESDVYLVLKDGKKLDYESSSLYNFREDAKDGAGHLTAPLASVPVIVEVEDIPDQRPEWVSFHASVAVNDETQPTTIQVAAIDGDYEINNTIIYGVIDDSGYVHIDGKTGLITIDPIPKDAGLDQLQFYVIALEEGDPNSNVVNRITLLIMY